MSFVLSDGSGTFDNNNGQNFNVACAQTKSSRMAFAAWEREIVEAEEQAKTERLQAEAEAKTKVTHHLSLIKPTCLRSILIILIIKILMPVQQIVLHIQDSYWYSRIVVLFKFNLWLLCIRVCVWV